MKRSTLRKDAASAHGRAMRNKLAAQFAVIALALVLPSAVGAQEASPTDDSTKLEVLEVTGSRIKRVDVEGQLPVEIISRQEIERSGYQSVEQLLKALSSAESIGGTQLSTGAGSSTYGVSTVSMRGLGEDRTLVLVNGRRLAPQAGFGGTAVNINVIPLAAIDRVEVLKDGASSVYGSDAMAGVVNFILRKDFSGVEIGGTTGQPTREGGGDSTRLSLTGGMVTGSLSFVGSVSAEKEKVLFGRDRNFAKRGTILPFFVSGATGQGNIEGSYTPGPGTPYTSAQEATRPGAGFGASPGSGFGNPMADSDPVTPGIQDNCAAISMFLNPTRTSKDTDPVTPGVQGAPFCAYDSAPDVGLVPDRELVNFTGNAVFKLTANHELFADVLWAESETTQAIQPSPLRRSFMLTDGRFLTEGVDPVLLIRPGNPAYDNIAVPYLNANNFGALVGNPIAVTSRVFDFGPRTSQDTSTQSRFVLGARGALPFGDLLDYEVAFSHNESELEGTVIDGYFSQVEFARVVNSRNDYNPWSLTQTADFQSALAASGAKYVGPTLNSESKSDIGEVLLRGNLAPLPAGILQFAAGAQYRTEEYINSPSPALETGDIAGLGGGIPPVDEVRNAQAVFGELNVPIIGTFEAGLGVRHDDYDDVGASTNHKFSAAWRPIDTVLLRATTGTGFRAPSMEELYRPQSLGSSEQFNDPGDPTRDPPVPPQPDLQVNSLTGGNPDLDPEDSRQTSYGMVWQATDAFSLGLDVWEIEIESAIITPSAQLIVSRFRAGDPAYAGLVTLDGSGNVESIVQTLQNTGGLSVNGVDVGLNYIYPVGPGRVSFVVNGTYLDDFEEQTPSGETSNKVGTNVDLTGAPVIGADGGGVALRWKHTAALTYAMNVWSATLVQNFYKGYEMGHDLNDVRRFVPSQSIYDANLMYTGFPNASLGIGMRNIFDTDPPLYIPSSNQFQSGYDAALEDPRRQFVYVTGSYRFPLP